MRLPAFPSLSRSRISPLPLSAFMHGLIAAALFFIVTALLTLTSGTTLAQQQPPPQPSPTLTPEKPPSLTNPVPDPKQDGVQYFFPTGHTMRGSFLQYWQQHGGLPQFGYPLTEEFTEPIGIDGAPIMVQYFERARFEHHPENQPPYDVLLGSLARQFVPSNAPTATATPLPSPALYFPETGHNLSGEFLAYWQAHGGLAVQGYPLTEPFVERSQTDGKEYTVQYFERARMELHPENGGTQYSVLLGQLGVQAARQLGYAYGRYPSFGNASDYSWIAGYLQPPYLMCPSCLCDSVVYSKVGGNKPETAFSPNGFAWDQFRTDSRNNLRIHTLVVVFGHRNLHESSLYPECFRPSYIVDGAYVNTPQ